MSELDKSIIDVRLLVRWLGVDGAIAGMEKSKRCTISVLKESADSLGIEHQSKPKRSELIDEIVRIASRRIDRPIDDLLDMQKEELVRYFESVEPEPHELLDLLKQLDLEPGREGRRNLLEFVASELSETGRFMRIASQGNS